MKNFFKFAIIIFLLGSLQSFAGNEPENIKLKGLDSFDKLGRKPKIFIEGIRLDFDYLRRNMQYVDFVNDPAVSDIHILITSQTSGSGGQAYSMRYINRTFENFSEYTITCTTASSDTEEEKRKKITNALSFGIMPFINESEISESLIIQYQSNGDENKVIKMDDPWNNWTFRGDFNGGIDAEESRQNINYFGNIRADKITENWKLRNNVNINVRTSKVKNGDVEYTSDRISNNYNSQIIKSLNPRWSMGVFLNYSKNNYTNFKYSLSAKPAIEYNIFPWDISDRKVFTLAYYIGPQWANYNEETIYGKLDEFLWQQTTRLNLQLVETWGEIDATLSASNYLHDFTKNRISFDTELSIRIVRGFSVNFDFGIENIHDQIYLAKGDLSLEDVLLNKVQLPSSFKVNTGIGLRLQFGSIYNNVVNNRL